MGQDVAALVGWGLAMLSARRPSRRSDNPAVALGLLLGAAAREGRDKLTLLLPPRTRAVRPLGRAARRGEHRQEAASASCRLRAKRRRRRRSYGRDRLFVEVAGPGVHRPEPRARPARGCRTPDGDDRLARAAALGAEFVRWEIATAIAGALLEINPFDEPNVQQAKDATTTLLGTYKSKGAFPRATPDLTLDGGITLTASRQARERLAGAGPDALLTLLQPGDYFALLAYIRPARLLAGDLACVPQRRPRPHACGDDVRRRPAVSALDGPAAQRRAEHRRVRPDHGDAARGPRHSRATRSPLARSNWRRRWAISRRSTRRAGARCTSTCRQPIAALAAPGCRRACSRRIAVQ